MDFFSSLGGYVHAGDIPAERAFAIFHYWFGPYFRLLRREISDVHKRLGIEYLEHCYTLYEAMTDYAGKQFPTSIEAKRYSPESIREFLDTEIEFLEKWSSALPTNIRVDNNARG